MTVILDNGHGKKTSGKRSPVWPDGSQLFEWEFNRDIVSRICDMLDAVGIRYERLVPEDVDISLKERCRRANAINDRTDGQCFLISIHGNAGGGTGWECYTSPGLTASDEIATALCTAFTFTPLPPSIRTSKSEIRSPCTRSCRGVFIPVHQDKGSTREILFPASCTNEMSETGLFPQETAPAMAVDIIRVFR